MVKSIQLKLSKIKYSGDSIGDDIRAEIEILGKFLCIDETIEVGKTVKIDQELGNFETDRNIFVADLRVTIIEKDALFNDVGNVDSSLKINTSITKPQQFTYNIQTRETRSAFGSPWGKRMAVFGITLEATVGDIERYTPDIKDGWLMGRDAKYNEISFPAYIRVKPEYIKNKREYFTPLEGAYRYKLVSTELQDDGSSYLIFGIKHEPMTRAKYSISQKIFILKNKKYRTAYPPRTIWKKGLYDIEIPDYPHGRNDQYIEAVRQKFGLKSGIAERDICIRAVVPLVA